MIGYRNDENKQFGLKMKEQSLSLYLHIPFCRHRCAYCDFNTYTGLSNLQEAYALALAKEIAQVASLPLADGTRVMSPRPVHTIFFGGGTPSLMTIQQLDTILSSVRQNFDLAPNAEITLEANPGTVDLAYLTAIRNLGINRLSFGMQSAIPTELTFLEREHDTDTVIQAVAHARQAGFDNISVDLIYGVPHQTLPSWEKSLDVAIALNLEHISLYCLTIEPGTPMHRWLHQGQFEPPDGDLAADQYELAMERLDPLGFVHYEISNWARPGRACQHNLTYWRNNEYLGLGAGAHGHAAGYRYHNVKQPRVYIRRLNETKPRHYPLTATIAHADRLTQADIINDTLITQLRLLEEGLHLPTFQTTFQTSLYNIHGKTIQQLKDWNLLFEQDNRLKLTRPGRFLSNQVFHRFL